MLSRLRKFTAVVAILIGWTVFSIVTQPAYAQSGPTHSYRKLGAAALAKIGTGGTRSFSVSGLTGYGLLMMYMWHEDHASLTRVVLSCTAKFTPPGSTADDYIVQDCETVVAGQCSSVTASWKKDLTTALRWGPWRMDVMGMERVDCSLVFTGGSVNDSIRVDAAMMTQ